MSEFQPDKIQRAELNWEKIRNLCPTSHPIRGGKRMDSFWQILLWNGVLLIDLLRVILAVMSRIGPLLKHMIPQPRFDSPKWRRIRIQSFICICTYHFYTPLWSMHDALSTQRRRITPILRPSSKPPLAPIHSSKQGKSSSKIKIHNYKVSPLGYNVNFRNLLRSSNLVSFKSVDFNSDFYCVCGGSLSKMRVFEYQRKADLAVGGGQSLSLLSFLSLCRVVRRTAVSPSSFFPLSFPILSLLQAGRMGQEKRPPGSLPIRLAMRAGLVLCRVTKRLLSTGLIERTWSKVAGKHWIVIVSCELLSASIADAFLSSSIVQFQKSITQ